MLDRMFKWLPWVLLGALLVLVYRVCTDYAAKEESIAREAAISGCQYIGRADGLPEVAFVNCEGSIVEMLVDQE